MTQQEANHLVMKYENGDGLPDGLRGDRERRTTFQGNEFYLVRIWQNDTVKVTYELRNGHPENITV